MTSTKKKTAKKKLSKSGDKGVWRCQAGCSLTERACEHLEKELSSVYARDSVSAQPTDFIDRFPGAQPSLDRESQAAAMNTRLVTYAIPELHRQVVIFHLVFGWSFSDIALSLGIPTKQTAHNIFRSSVAMLRERNYEPERF